MTYMSEFEECPYEPCPVAKETVMDLTPNWWERNRLIQRVRHLLGICEGAGMVIGPRVPTLLYRAVPLGRGFQVRRTARPHTG